jgi:DDE superfamily endonuclease
LYFVAHPKSAEQVLKLKSIKIVFFPPNMTSVLQPMDLGIIRCLKHHYRHELVLKRIQQIEERLPCSDVNILEAINIVAKVWETKVSAETVANCFGKAGFHKKDDAIVQLLEPLVEFEESFAVLQGHLDTGLTNFNEYVSCDEHVEITGQLTDEDILYIVTTQEDEKENCYTEPNDLPTTSESLESPSKPSRNEMRKAMDLIIRSLQMTDNVPENTYKNIYDVEKHLKL